MGTVRPRRYDGRRQAWRNERPSWFVIVAYVATGAAYLLTLLIAAWWLVAVAATP